MAKQRTLKDLGLDKSHAEYLVGHAQQMHAPDEFTNEVQRHLNRILGVPPLGNEPKNDSEAIPVDPSKTGAEAFSSGQKQVAQAEAISSISEGGPPQVPAPKSTRPSPKPDFSSL